MPRSSARISLLAPFALLTALSLPASATTQVQWVTPMESDIASGSGLQSINLAETPFVSDDGVVFVGKAQGDDGTGTVRVYSEIDSRGVGGTPDLLIGSAIAMTTSNGTLVSSAGGGPVDVTFVFTFDGSFHTYSGNVFHQLAGTLTVGVPSATVAFTNVTYQSQLVFRTDLLDDTAVRTASTGNVSYFEPGFVYVDEPYANATSTVISDAMDDLIGEIRLTVTMAPGQSFVLVNGLSTQVTPEPVHPETGLPFDYSQSWGAVDGFNTGRLSIVLPEGYALEGNTGLLANAVVTPPVPEPATWGLMVAGLAVLGGFARRRAH